MRITTTVLNSIRLAFDSKRTLSRNEIFDSVLNQVPDLSRGGLGAVLVAVCVNNPRRSKTISQLSLGDDLTGGMLDVLFITGGASTDTYTYALCDSSKHQVLNSGLEADSTDMSNGFVLTSSDGYSFSREAHLRDFVANLSGRLIIQGAQLHTFVHPSGRKGVEYPVGVGVIDYLAIDDDGNFFIFEFKLNKGVDCAIGQVCRYMGWVRSHLANGKRVKGVIVSNYFDEKIRYAGSVVPDILLFQYSMSFTLTSQA